MRVSRQFRDEEFDALEQHGECPDKERQRRKISALLAEAQHGVLDHRVVAFGDGLDQLADASDDLVSLGAHLAE